MFLQNSATRTRKLKDLEEYNDKMRIINETNMLKNELRQVQNTEDNIQGDINMRFMKSNIKETELKNYIGKLNGKLYQTSSETDNKIESLHSDIIDKISVIQAKIKREIEYTKKEMEKEVEDRFNEAERKQKELMNQKIKEQTKVFDRMNYTRGELEKIIKRFEETNTECSELLKRNESLRVTLETTKMNNHRLSKKVETIKEEYERLYNEQNKLDAIALQHRPLSKNKELFLNTGDKDNTNTFFNNKNKESSPRLHSAAPDKEIIRTLQDNIHYARKDYNKTYCSFISAQQKRTEAQQLLQKCIEDVGIELTSSRNKLSHLKSDKITDANSIKQYIARLEEKMRILTFIYDNGLNIRIKKKTLIK